MAIHDFKYPIYADRLYTFKIDGEEHTIIGEELILAALSIAQKQHKMSILDTLGITYSRDISSLS
jgi:hypothetical protein